jgi:hypothetical protein
MISLPTEIGAVSLKETWEGFSKGVGPSGPYVEKTYLLEDWGSSNAVINALRGTINLSGGSTLAVPPHACPESPNLYCVDAKADPQCEIDAKDGGRPRFKHALIRCRYGTVPYNALPSMDPNGANSFPNDSNPNTAYTYALCRMRIGSEVIRVAGSVFKFATSPNLPWDTAAGITVGVADLVFTRKFVPRLPTALILSYINKVNDVPIFGQPRGQIQFRGADTEEEYSSDGTKTQQLVLSFKWREYDFNRHLRPDVRSFDLVKDSSNLTPYEYSDLRPLLTAIQ